MAVFALVPHRLRKEACGLASAAAEWLAERGHEVRVPAQDAEGVRGAQVVPESEVADGLDLAVALGGDGTMLHAVQLVCGAGVPVMGVNVGHLGYLTTIEPTHLFEGLERFLAGDYKIEHRMMLDVTVHCGDDEAVHTTALNEAVLEKTASGHTVQVAIRINDRPFTTAAADGMIVATPTGSTAYNFSARGPIVSPLHRALILTPVAPHMLFDRSLVLDPEESVELEVLDGRPAILVVDGRNLATLAPGDRVAGKQAKHDALLVAFDGRDFHQILKAKFKLADR
ncbi:MAG TPA: NAD(+)/NADH kinase [Acidimicrobiales bacterium]|jgi:NAD+ kinase|nr:NAD(+)/NADH kinase [Acidimicrobiales bacterium]